MKRILKNIYNKVLRIMPAKLVINIENLFTYKRLFNKNDVKYFGEKMQYFKLYGNLEQYTNYADKYKVREYITKKIGEEYLIPLLGVYNKPEEIDYAVLPNRFVLKANHGCEYNIIIRDKNIININKTNNQLRKWLKEDFWKIKKEYQYKNIEKKIICEKYLEDKNNELQDYKFFCFDGNPQFLKVDVDRFKEHKCSYFDLEWNYLDLKETKIKAGSKEFVKPENFEEMIKIATKLSEDFKFVRVDLYNVKGKIYFGELTFTHASGGHAFKPLDKDIEIAERIKI